MRIEEMPDEELIAMFKMFFTIITCEIDPTNVPKDGYDLCQLRAIVHELLDRGYKQISEPEWIKE